MKTGENRDQQRGRLYRAEREALKPLANKLPTTDDAFNYLKKGSTKAWLVRRYGSAVDFKLWSLKVSDGRGTRNAYCYGSSHISLPLWARCDWVALHEFAHAVHKRIGNHFIPEYAKALKGGVAHGWQFAAIYLDLVTAYMGKEAAEALKASFKKHNVRWKPKATRTLTDEQRAALVERARIARQAKSQNKIAASQN